MTEFENYKSETVRKETGLQLNTLHFQISNYQIFKSF